jgi:hypothetical protein
VCILLEVQLAHELRVIIWKLFTDFSTGGVESLCGKCFKSRKAQSAAQSTPYSDDQSPKKFSIWHFSFVIFH